MVVVVSLFNIQTCTDTLKVLVVPFCRSFAKFSSKHTNSMLPSLASKFELLAVKRRLNRMSRGMQARKPLRT